MFSLETVFELSSLGLKLSKVLNQISHVENPSLVDSGL